MKGVTSRMQGYRMKYQKGVNVWTYYLFNNIMMSVNSIFD